MNFFLGIDIGATFIKYGLFDAGLKKISAAKIRIAKDFSSFMEQLVAIVDKVAGGHPLRAVGVGVPGFIAKQENRIELAPNIPFLKSVYLQREIQNRISLPVTVENDANVAGMGEYVSMPEPRPASFVLLTLGTGLGSGIVLNGQIWQGECGYAGELGHVVVNSEGRSCGCGNRGCAETESSESGIVKTYQELSSGPRAQDPEGQPGGQPVTGLEIFQRSRRGDQAALDTFARAGYYLGILLLDIANFLNPAVIAIGGGVAAAGDAILKPAVAEFSRRIYARNFACTTVRLAGAGNDAGIIGAAHLAALDRR